MTVRPLHDRILVQRIDEGEQNVGGVIIPDTAKEKPQQGTVKSPAHAQRFLWVHGLVQNLFRVGRHLLRAAHHCLLRTLSFLVWSDVTGTC